MFNDSNHEKAWCLRVAGNLAKNRIKYNAVRDADELNEELIDEQREDLSFVWEAVKALPIKYREVIHLFYHEGYPPRDSACFNGEPQPQWRPDRRRAQAPLIIRLTFSSVVIDWRIAVLWRSATFAAGRRIAGYTLILRFAIRLACFMMSSSVIIHKARPGCRLEAYHRLRP